MQQDSTHEKYLKQSEDQYSVKGILNHQSNENKDIIIMDLSDQNLTSLKGIQKQTYIRILNLNNNKLNDEVFEEISVIFPQLEILFLQNNEIQNLSQIYFLDKLPLIELQLRPNPITIPSYYREVYDKLPNLYSLDGFDRDGLRIQFPLKDEPQKNHEIKLQQKRRIKKCS